MKRILLALSLSLVTLTSIAQDKNQCAGTTKAGERCKHKTENTYCKTHDPATPRCGADKKTGGKCKRIVNTTGEKCFDHK